MILLQPSHICSCLVYMPANFVNKYLSQNAKCIKLQVSNGREWPVQIRWAHGRCNTQKGWTAFVKNMNLKAGDICLLELIRMDDLPLEVSVF
ncbi:hypothetical protein JRO89_XS02G0056400 [Xanthoceras sorbifolium]|uniref:TF-B3 domain-containing protein n=1 Tax=Xanthoceras sorbifolium TaxID=99658 RepID=A0ABQ8IEU3_9ROSI|nr:hypothetical protein JRO89_XS02G0056400 [Xanthoceras sorbifolium]